ncbi:MAG: bifunctional 4-hydroxy-3-methylbut-2-enyl diphosphate reductase/30S ribosomal protein S1 [Clostridia bacterium]|nr:bifunctional 4-hydroxy-3-methylbut-2-enyl diphosphate reductase/30S ribosomal protein S1 [Clostridia bacterium]
MKLIISRSAGFCFGVQRAVEIAQRAAKERGKVYTYGELIHNESVVSELKAQGIIPVDDIGELNSSDALVIRSHGVAPDVYERAQLRGVSVIDATCPYVKRIHDEVAKYHAAGWSIAIAGRFDHPEVIGINGWCGNTAHIVATVDECSALPHTDRRCLVAQTTFSEERIVAIERAVKQTASEFVFINTICKTTTERQREAEELAQKCDIMVVIGGRNSSNTAKLSDICRKHCRNVYTIANPKELLLAYMENGDIMGVIAGASTPQWMIREVVTIMSELEKTMADCPEEQGMEEIAEDAATVTEPIAAETAAVTDEPVVKEPDAAPADAPEASFAEAFEKTLVRIKGGQIISGSVVQIVDGEVCVNIGYKSDGFIPRSEFSHDETIRPEDVLSVGDTVEVEVLKVNDGEGNVLLSRKNVEQKKAWEVLADDQEIESKVFDAVGKEAVKGGLICEINGVRAFVPASLLALRRDAGNAEIFVGQPLRVKIIEVDKARKRIVASHRAVLIEERELAKKARYEKIKPGSILKGTVRKLTDFGAFVNIGEVDGLVHVTELSWARTAHPSDILEEGQEIEVIVLKVDVAKERVSLGYKQLQPKPWETALDKYPVGSIVEGKVVRILDFGAFVSLEPMIDGLIHISQISVRRVEKVEDEVKIGEVVRCKVLEVNPESRKMSLSRKQAILDENPEIAEELARERAERSKRFSDERGSSRRPQGEQQSSGPRQRTERPERSERSDRGERPERRPRREREEVDYNIPPVEAATTSLAALLVGFSADDEPAADAIVEVEAVEAVEPVEAVEEVPAEAVEAVDEAATDAPDSTDE